jgi:hypothetical protein
MLVHSVFFWLKKDLKESEKKDFLAGLKSLEAIDVIRKLYVGSPAPSERAVVEKGYTYGLTVLLDDLEAHDKYQSDETHQRFLKTFSWMWDKVLVFDPTSEFL